MGRDFIHLFPDLVNRPGSRSVELQIWLVIAFIAGLRTLKEIIQDLFSGETQMLIPHLIILVSAVGIVILIWRNRITRVSWWAGVVLLLLLLLAYVRFGGVEGSAEYNLMGLAVLFTLGYSGREQLFLFGAFFIFLVLLSLDFYLDGPISRSRFVMYTTGLNNYFSTLITLVLLVWYFKYLLLRDTSELRSMRHELKNLNRDVKKINNELKSQQALFQTLNSELSREIEKNVHQIIIRNQAIEDYIVLSGKSLQRPLVELKLYVHELQGEDFLESRLRMQINELDSVIQRLNAHRSYEEINDGQ